MSKQRDIYTEIALRQLKFQRQINEERRTGRRFYTKDGEMLFNSPCKEKIKVKKKR